MAKNITILLVTLLVISGLVFVALFGVGGFMPGVFEEGAIRKGLDLAGGSLIVYQPDVEDTSSVEDADLDKVVAILTRRLSNAGYTEASLTQLKDDRRIQIEIPEEKDLDKARDLLGNIGKLTFVASDGSVILTGSDVKDAAVRYDYTSELSLAPEYFVEINLNSSAVQKFAEATRKFSTPEHQAARTNYISIALDDEVISKPYVSQELNMADIMITASPQYPFDEATVTYMASVISSGQLPFSLVEVRADNIGPTLGEKALETALFAGAVGIALVMLFMIAVYRLPGLMSAIALVAYIAIEAVILVITKVNLSLPGIAGIVLSIGMAVDANVIINERIKEELRAGKGTVSAVLYGFKGAFTSILDSNITTVIAAAVLWYFGTGTVQGFAITLFIGIVVSMFTALVVTRTMMLAAAKAGIRNSKLYGI